MGLHGSNFGEGCNGNCLDESGNKIRKDVLHKTGTLRWMAQKYVLGGVGSSAVRTEFWETVDIKTVKGQINEECECLARHGPEKSKWPGDSWRTKNGKARMSSNFMVESYPY